ncbi:hypothetical protein EI94DRAFT_1708140 [Lactarius quietus]|nr:hypothetical protein EI94DRAFT_1708140 [Lactarius quietus]
MHSEEGSAFDFMQHIPSPIIDAPPTTSQVDTAIVQSGGPLSAITVSSSSAPSVPPSGPPSGAISTSGSHKRPAPYDFMDQIPASQRIAHNLPTQDLQPRADVEDDTSGSDSIPDSEEDVIQVRHVLKALQRPSLKETQLGLACTPTFNAALDAEAEVLRHLLIDMKQMKKELHRLNERLMRDYLILETLIMNICKRPEDLEDPDI